MEMRMETAMTFSTLWLWNEWVSRCLYFSLFSSLPANSFYLFRSHKIWKREHLWPLLFFSSWSLFSNRRLHLNLGLLPCHYYIYYYPLSSSLPEPDTPSFPSLMQPNDSLLYFIVCHIGVSQFPVSIAHFSLLTMSLGWFFHCLFSRIVESRCG